jgi:hypothetical protein
MNKITLILTLLINLTIMSNYLKQNIVHSHYLKTTEYIDINQDYYKINK